MPATRRGVLIVDDDEAIRDSLAALLESEGYIPETFESAERFLARHPEDFPGCAIIDIRMPGMSGLELQAELRRRKATIPVIVLTSHGDVSTAVAALKAGAVDFIEKPFNVPALLAAVQVGLSRQDERQRHGAERRAFETKLAHLTTREREVMDLVAAGDPNKVVAAKLGISVRTAEVHRAKVMEKMQCGNLSALIHLLLRHQQLGE
jgi:FixJ family two-component response regulator